jgi:hypothetical protein
MPTNRYRINDYSLDPRLAGLTSMLNAGQKLYSDIRQGTQGSCASTRSDDRHYIVE